MRVARRNNKSFGGDLLLKTNSTSVNWKIKKIINVLSDEYQIKDNINNSIIKPKTSYNNSTYNMNADLSQSNGDSSVFVRKIETITELIADIVSNVTFINTLLMPYITNLNIGNNQLTSLDLTNQNSLKNLYINNNDFSNNTPNVSNCPDLEILQYNSCQLATSIDVTNNPKLNNLRADSNAFSSLDLSNNLDLTILRSGYNSNITSLDLSNNAKLTYIHLYGLNNLDTLILPILPDLYYVNIGGYNNLVEVDFSQSPLITYFAMNHTSNLRKVNLKNGNSNKITSLTHSYYVDCCFLVDDVNDPVVQDWNLRAGDVITDDINVYNNF